MSRGFDFVTSRAGCGFWLIQSQVRREFHDSVEGMSVNRFTANTGWELFELLLDDFLIV